MDDIHKNVFLGEMSRCDHFVQIYDANDTFIDTLAGFVSGGLEEGYAAIVIATPDYRRELDARLTALGIDLVAAQSQDQYISLDAEETMKKFLVNGWPDDQLFADAVTDVLQRAGANGRKVRAFGEIVALMWRQKYYAATIRLEQLWNEVCQRESLSLFCAYPKTGFTQAPAESIARICALHSKVLFA